MKHWGNKKRSQSNGPRDKKERKVGGGNGVHYANRGKVINAPKDVIMAKPSQTVNIDIEMRNNTHYKYKPGTHFVSLFNEAQKQVFDEVNMPIEEVEAMTDYKVSIPLKIKENALPYDKKEEIIQEH